MRNPSLAEVQSPLGSPEATSSHCSVMPKWELKKARRPWKKGEEVEGAAPSPSSCRRRRRSSSSALLLLQTMPLLLACRNLPEATEERKP